jgi:hypothetical protein
MKLKALMGVMGALLMCVASMGARATDAGVGAGVVSGSYTVTVKRPDGKKTVTQLVTSSGTSPAMVWLGDRSVAPDLSDGAVVSCKSTHAAPGPSGALEPFASSTWTVKQMANTNSGLSISVAAVGGEPGVIDTVLVVSDTHADYQSPKNIRGCSVAVGRGETHSLTQAGSMKEGATASWEMGAGYRVTLTLDHVDYFQEAATAQTASPVVESVVDHVPEKIGDACKVAGMTALMEGVGSIYCGADLHWAKGAPH